MILLCFSVGGLVTGFRGEFEKKLVSNTNPLFIDSAFSPYKPNVNTRWDGTYFYVESKGIPDHEMMRGIRSWQQQVPIPQCYIGNNAWSIPLYPQVAAVSVPVNPQHFLRGAIAIAANGIPIFNPYTNTGVDAQLDGQLDVYGGHSGRADDYHYHIAPLQLYQTTKETVPIAFALDGYAVYGAKEPDGQTMMTLDSNHGHFGSNGVYHYHGTQTSPYMIGRMVGKVKEDSTLQIVPQASAKPVRPATSPLKGAVITKCIPKSSHNGYVLSYTLNNQEYSVDYSWTSNGTYTFSFISPGGTTNQSYNGFVQCSIPTAVDEATELMEEVLVLPNPSSEVLQLRLSGNLHESDVVGIDVSSLSGSTVFNRHGWNSLLDVKNVSPGTYFVRVYFRTFSVSKKISIQ
jgi:hypothetical protein